MTIIVGENKIKDPLELRLSPIIIGGRALSIREILIVIIIIK